MFKIKKMHYLIMEIFKIFLDCMKQNNSDLDLFFKKQKEMLGKG